MKHDILCLSLDSKVQIMSRMKTNLLQLLLTLSTSVQLMSGYNPLEDESTDRGCLDHSDCTMMGYKYGCLVYKCVDHSMVTPCHDHLECPQGQQCIRSHPPPTSIVHYLCNVDTVALQDLFAGL